MGLLGIVAWVVGCRWIWISGWFGFACWGVGWLLLVIVVSLDCAGGCVWNCGFCGSGFVVVVV